MVLSDVEETVTTVEVDEETCEEVIKVLAERKKQGRKKRKTLQQVLCPSPFLKPPFLLSPLAVKFQ